MRKQGIPVYDHYKMFKNRNYNNASQKRLAKFALIKYHINFLNYGTYIRSYVTTSLYIVSCLFLDFSNFTRERIILECFQRLAIQDVVK